MNKRKQLWMCTDLDGSLLDENYSWEPAQPALQRIRAQAIPLILNSSKTFSEMKLIADKLELKNPLICENGGVIAIPEHTPLAEGLDGDRCAGHWLLYPGIHREKILNTLHRLREQHGYRFSGFADWEREEVMKYTGLSETDASRAKCRFATEPIIWEDTDARKRDFEEQLKPTGLRTLRGGRFLHIMGGADKAEGMRYVLELYYRAYPDEPRKTLALGDSENDLDMLSSADIAGVIPNRNGAHLLPTAPRILNTEHAGPAGWNEIVEQVLNEEML